MSSDSHVYDSVKMPKTEEVSKECESDPTETGHEVDINAFFEADKSALAEKLECEKAHLQNDQLISGHYLYDAENAANRQQRHIILNKIRVNRGVSILLGLLIIFFFFGLVVAIVGTVFHAK